MTTIAWDGKTLASDSQMTGSYIEQKNVSKIIRKGGDYYGIAGRLSEGKSFVEGEIDKLSDETELLIVNAKGKCVWKGRHASEPMPDKTAIGSGANFAMGAMLAGASAVEAVKIASKLDISTGGKIQSKRVKK